MWVCWLYLQKENFGLFGFRDTLSVMFKAMQNRMITKSKGQLGLRGGVFGWKMSCGRGGSGNGGDERLRDVTELEQKGDLG